MAARKSACQLVTQSEMSAILGRAVVAASGGNERPPSATECIYSPAAGRSPYAEVVNWGGGDKEALGTAAGLLDSPMLHVRMAPRILFMVLAIGRTK